MPLNDVTIEKVSGGLGLLAPSTDGVCAFVASGVAVVGGVQLNTVYRITSLQDLVALQITETYDADNDLLVYENIKEVFRINPNADLYVRIVAQATTYAQMMDSVEPIMAASEGRVGVIAFNYCPATPVAVGTVTALLAGIAAAQTTAATQFGLHRPVVMLLEGVGVGATNINDAGFNLRNLSANNVAVMCGQNYGVSSIVRLDESEEEYTPYASYAAVGTALGAVTRARVNENIGWVQRFNMFGGNLSFPALGGALLTTLTQSLLTTANDKGLIFFLRHTGVTGIYFNDAPTCTEITDDYGYIEMQRTANKASRLIRAAFLPNLNGPINVDPVTGKLPQDVVNTLQTKGRKVITDAMLNNGELSGFTFIIDPNQNILQTSELNCQLALVPTGTARQIVIQIGFTNPFNN
jgi:hypothetical protein